MRITPKNELDHRCLKLQHYMAEVSLDSVIMVQSADLFYFTGSIQSGTLYVPVSGQPLYMVRKELSRARMESGLKEVLPLVSMKDVSSYLASYGYPEPKRIGMEMDVLPINLFERYRKVFPAAVFTDASPMIRKVRMIKTRYEIHAMMDAANMANKVHLRAKEVIREGVSDIELASELEFLARREGHQGLIRMRAFNAEIFYGHIFSGEDSAVPTYADMPLGGMGITPAFGQGAGYKKIARNEPITVDFASCFDGYLIDQTRIFAIGGLSDSLLKAYDDMLRIQNRMAELAVERPTCGQIYDECLALAVQLGYADSFMGNKGAQVSFIGHGLGIEVDEYPLIAKGMHDMQLEPGMAFAFEPKVVFHGKGAVGIENTFYLTEDNLKQLTFTEEELVIL